jgi:serine/threonine protein kinase
VATALRDRLQEALGGVYVLERELGGGGMSRVFVARDDALGRRIVVKVLPPEMAAAVNVERFRREIPLAASLLMIVREPALDVLRATSRFQSLARRIGPA